MENIDKNRQQKKYNNFSKDIHKKLKQIAEFKCTADFRCY